MNLMNLLTSDGFIVVNREFARDIGMNTAIVLYELIKQHIYFTERNETTSFRDIPGYFYEVAEVMEYWTLLTRREQDPCIKKLIELGYINQLVKGIPAKRYFKVNEEKLLEYFSKKKSSFDKMSKQAFTASQNKHSPNVESFPYMYKEKREEKREDTAPKVAQSSPELFLNHGSKVKLKPLDYDTLCLNNTKERVDETIAQINDYEDAHGKKGYKCYAAAIRQWLRREVKPTVGRPAQKYSPKKEDWPKINREKVETWLNKNPDKLKHILLEHYYATNKLKRNLTIDFRLIDPDELASQFKRISETYDFIQ